MTDHQAKLATVDRLHKTRAVCSCCRLTGGRWSTFDFQELTTTGLIWMTCLVTPGLRKFRQPAAEELARRGITKYAIDDARD